eukprot:scaffold5472_cov146-Skeletonema_menzelii.AAC.16
MSQAEFKRRLKALMLKPENQVCSDCPERQPRWASLIVPPPGAPAGSLPMGAFCCLECSGSHRRDSSNETFVQKSSGKEKEVLAMENGGNAKVNAIFEAHLNVNKPNNSASGPVRERFIRDKYERRKFYDPRAFETSAQMSNGGGQEEEAVIAGVQRRLASNRTPSDAARRRVEERAARNRSGGKVGSSSPRRSKPAKAKAPVPVAAPEPVADLLDFGDFNSVEAASSFGQTNDIPTPTSTTAVAASLPAAPTVAPPAPPAAAVDMFANMTSPVQNAAPAATQQQQHPEKKTMSNADILSMFNTPSTQHNPMQQNMFPMQMAGGMGGGNSMGMMNANNNNMGMMNQQQMGMNNMGMGGNMNQTMGMQNGMGQMNQQQQQPMGMNNMMAGNNMNQMMMMQQQQQQNQMQQMNMMGGNNMMMPGGGMMQGGNQFGSQMGQAQQKRGGSTYLGKRLTSRVLFTLKRENCAEKVCREGKDFDLAPDRRQEELAKPNHT